MTKSPLPAIEYASPPALAKRRWFSPRATTVCVLITCAVHIAFAVPTWGIKMIFRDFNMKLPTLTQHFLDASDWWTNGRGWIAGVAIAILGPIGLTVLRRPDEERRNEAALWLMAGNIVFLAINAIVLYTMCVLYFVPMTGLMTPVR